MTDKLDLSVPSSKSSGPARMASVISLLLIVALIGAANLWATLSVARNGKDTQSGTGLSAEAQKALALKLEKQSLTEAAERAWQGYLDAASPGDEDRAKIWYRIGRMNQDAGRFAAALEAYYRSESLAEITELKPEIARRTQECLEALGKFSALRYELAERTAMEPGKEGAGEEVVAEIGPEKITKADVDKAIERAVEMQMAAYGAQMPPETLRQQKERMLQQFSSKEQRIQFLNQMLLEELLFRKARQEGLAEKAETRELLRDTERKILASRVMQQALEDRIKISDVDLRSYYEANKEDFVEPESAQIDHILVKDEEKAKEVLKALSENADFAEVAKNESLDEETKEKGGAIEETVRKDGWIPGIGNSKEASELIFSTEVGELVKKPVKTEKGWHVIRVRSREPARQKPFEAVKQQVHSRLRREKTQEVQEALFQELMRKYDVVIHMTQFETEKKLDSESAKP